MVEHLFHDMNTVITEPPTAPRRNAVMAVGRRLAHALGERSSVAVVAARLGVSESMVRKTEALALGRIAAAFARERLQDRLAVGE